MTPEQIDRVFGRGRLKMVTGEHVEVYREAVGPGERRRYTKRFAFPMSCRSIEAASMGRNSCRPMTRV